MWDILAPASILFFLYKENQNLRFKIKLKNGKIYDLFEMNEYFLNQINEANQNDGKVGFLLIYDVRLIKDIEEIFNLE